MKTKVIISVSISYRHEKHRSCCIIKYTPSFYLTISNFICSCSLLCCKFEITGNIPIHIYNSDYKLSLPAPCYVVQLLQSHLLASYNISVLHHQYFQDLTAAVSVTNLTNTEAHTNQQHSPTLTHCFGVNGGC